MKLNVCYLTKHNNKEHMFKWRAVYKEPNGKISQSNFLPQVNKDGSENRYQDINRFLLGRFDILKEDNKTIIHSLFLKEGQRLIFRRRNFIKLDGEKTLAYLVGWVKTVYTVKGSEDIYSITYIFEDGTTASDDHRENLELLPEEQ